MPVPLRYGTDLSRQITRVSGLNSLPTHEFYSSLQRLSPCTGTLSSDVVDTSTVPTK